MSRIFIDDQDSMSRPAKRRKSTGLNSRFDRMIHIVNVAHRPPKGRRARSASSTSGSSVPKTPVDEYDIHHGRLGPEFSVLKLAANMWDGSSSDSCEQPAPPPHVPLPPWLADTFSTLGPTHPLRLLLPRTTRTEAGPIPLTEHDAISDLSDEAHFPVLENDFEPETRSRSTSPMPFSTAGPCSTISYPIDSILFADDQLPFSVPGPRSILPNAKAPALSDYLSPPQQSDALILPSRNLPGYNSPPSAPSPFEESMPEITDYLSDLDDIPLIPTLGASCTPVSGYNARHAIYFDSPAEDPVHSDPLEVGYELESLDFKWKPFIQTANVDAVGRKTNPVPNSDDPAYEMQGESIREIDEPLHSSPNEKPGSSNAGPQKTPEAKFFAPAPGIYISPLRGDPPTSPNPCLNYASQTSHDSIEDWDDAN
ncbi:hypothetical protein C8F01DRAFT_1243396 [Mycena amicta]|nr:hypothetical protein C8F01DRAFT_1243396 [Mycena amicta]